MQSHRASIINPRVAATTLHCENLHSVKTVWYESPASEHTQQRTCILIQIFDNHTYILRTENSLDSAYLTTKKWRDTEEGEKRSHQEHSLENFGIALLSHEAVGGRGEVASATPAAEDHRAPQRTHHRTPCHEENHLGGSLQPLLQPLICWVRTTSSQKLPREN